MTTPSIVSSKLMQAPLKGYFVSVFLIWLISIGLLSSVAMAQTVTHTLSQTGLTAQADYRAGQVDKPAVLIIHGFLTTNQFNTVQIMAKTLHDEGFTTLAPTFTLGISQRQESIKCNAIHTHTLAQDVNEITAWVNWLKQQGHSNVIIAGHSSGSLEALEYLTQAGNNKVIGAIFTSFFYLKGKELGTLQEQVKQAKNLVASGINRPQKYNFLFCKNNYYATPESFLSYLKLDRNYVLKALSNLKIPHYTLMGGADRRYESVGQNWLAELKQTGTNLVTVDGANHFFTSEHEFDLQDHLIDFVHKINHQHSTMRK